LLATLAAHMAPGEKPAIEITHTQDQHTHNHQGQDRQAQVVMTMQLPGALALRDDASLFHALTGSPSQTPSAGMFGTGFALRLAGAEARSAHGSLTRAGEFLQLRLPALCATPATPTVNPVSPIAAPISSASA